MSDERIAVLAGDFYHRPEPMIAALEAACADLALKPAVFVDPEKVPWESLGEYRALVVAREGRIDPEHSRAAWTTEARERAVEAFVDSGGGLAALHAGLASYDFSAPYGRTVRGTFLFHPPEHPEFRVRAYADARPGDDGRALLRGFEELSIQDEMYFVRVDSERTARLLESYSPDYGSSAAAWAHEPGKGRVFCFTPGHRDEVLADPGYRRFLTLGLQWITGGLNTL